MPYKDRKSSYPKKTGRYNRRKLPAIVPYEPRNQVGGVVAANLAHGALQAARRAWQISAQARNADIAARNMEVKAKNASKSAQTYNVKNSGSPAELTGAKFKLGRYKPLTIKQLEKLTIARRITRFQNLGPLDKGVDRGANWLGTIVTTTPTVSSAFAGGNNNFAKNMSDVSGGAVHYRAPYHLFCLNSTSLTDVASPQGPALQPFIGISDGNVNFASLYGCKPDLTGATTQWQTEYQNFGDAPSQKYIRHEWYDIRIGLRNAIQQTTVYDIWVFQFKDGYLDPLEIPGSVEEIKDRKAFYQSLMSSGVNHPLMNKGQNEVYRKIKFWRKLRVVMDKQQTTDQDASPDLKTIKLFIRDGKLYDHQYASGPANTTLLPSTYTLQNNSWIPQGAANVINAEYPKARARVWLMIRALDSTTSSTAGNGGDETITSDDTLSVNTTPSYDIQIRHCESCRI